MQKITTCFHGGKVGHWASRCTQRRGGALESTRYATDSEYPVTNCRCGQGMCEIRVSGSEKNPGRKYYHCPGRGPYDCKYFKWCDQLRKDDIGNISSPEVFPICGECGAGICTVDTRPDGRSYFVCPIKKGQGACGFSKLRDGQTDNTRYGEFDDPAEMLPEEEVLAELEGLPGPPVVEQFGEIESPDVWENVERTDSFAKSGSTSELPAEMGTSTVIRISEVVEKYSNRKPAPELQLVGSGMQTPAGISDAVVMENSPGSYPRKRSRPESSTSNISSQNKKALVRCLNLEASPCPADRCNNIMAGAAVKVLNQAAAQLQKELTDLLCCMSPHNHLTMLSEAESTFSTLNLLQADYQIFFVRVKSYIERAAELAEIEKSMESTLPSKELVKQYEDEKSRTNQIANLYDKEKKALMDSCELSRNDALNENKTQQLLLCGKTKAAQRGNQLGSLSGQLQESKRRVEAISAEIVDSLVQAEETDIKLSAAKAAFEKARTQLFL